MADNIEITFETIVEYVEEVKEMQANRIVESAELTSMERLMRVPYAIVQKALKKLNLEIKYIKKYNLGQLYYFGDDKRWYLDFLAYCLAMQSNLNFDLTLFEDNEDRKEIFKFVKNKVYGALCDSASKDVLFAQTDLVYEKYYRQMAKGLRKKDQHYILIWNERRYILPINWFEPVVFYHRYGIPQLPDKVRRALAGKDVIDAGAFIGDSALILEELNPKRVYAFEPWQENTKLLRKTAELNDFSNLVIVDKALSSHEATLTVQPIGSATFIHKFGSQKIDTTTIDSFVDKYQLTVGLIKMDIEGHEHEAVNGSEKTINIQKPVLLISLYHDGKSFFEIPRLLNKWVPEYKFRFLNLHKMDPTYERILMAYTNA